MVRSVLALYRSHSRHCIFEELGTAMEAYAIFEGGGAKGLAHVGALAAAERRGVTFKGVAGASAGAIVASLVACGYKAGEMFDPDLPEDPSAVYGLDFRTLLGDADKWDRFLRARDDLKSAAKSRWPGFQLYCFHSKYELLIKTIAKHQGVFDTAPIAHHLDRVLETKLLETSPGLCASDGLGSQRGRGGLLRVKFKHVGLPLKIIATDIQEQKLVEFSQQLTPDFPVALAVAASICLPVVFIPLSLKVPDGKGGRRRVRAIDGGLLSNFPAWLFDRERQDDGPHTPTFGFRLIERASADAEALPRFADYVTKMVVTVLAGDPLLETREIENLHEIPVTVSFGTLHFHLNAAEKVTLYQEGFEGALGYLDRPGFPREPAVARAALQAAVEGFRELHGLGSEPLIRANIVCKTTKGTLRVTYSYCMDSDADTDDRLEFPFGSGATSVAWMQKAPVICDLVDAKANISEWKMTKYQQALVRTDLTSLLSCPILAPNGDVLGVLNLDSPDAGMLTRFGDPGTEEWAAIVLPSLATILAPNTEGGHDE